MTVFHPARLRVLVVDDNPVNREVTQHLLTRLGHAADAACDGAEALRAHHAAPYDLILMDCEMPVLDGYAATRRLREEENGCRTPVFGLSGLGGQEQEAQCRAAGMDGLLVKPLRDIALHAALTQSRLLPGITAARQHTLAADEMEAVQASFGEHFADLAALYQRDGMPRIVAMRAASSAGNARELARIAHAFAGSSIALGATALAGLCATVEREAKAALQATPEEGRDGPHADLAGKLEELEQEYRRVCERLRVLLGH